MVNDSVSDLLTRLRNASMRHSDTVQVPATRFSVAILEALVRTGYLERTEALDNDGRPMVAVSFKYIDGENVIKAIRQLSTRGLRRYSSYKTLRAPRHGGGILLLSTPLGVLSDREARQRGVGGELLCEILS
mgnify:CR=1 FL=1